MDIAYFCRFFFLKIFHFFISCLFSFLKNDHLLGRVCFGIFLSKNCVFGVRCRFLFSQKSWSFFIILSLYYFRIFSTSAAAVIHFPSDGIFLRKSFWRIWRKRRERERNYILCFGQFLFTFLFISSKAISLLVFHWMRVVAVNFSKNNQRGLRRRNKCGVLCEKLKSRWSKWLILSNKNGFKMSKVIFWNIFLKIMRFVVTFFFFSEFCTQNQNSDMYHSSQKFFRGGKNLKISWFDHDFERNV